ncbi:AraC family transcriptional regulator [Nocardia panacis]|uniref:AraC family transcriptional regulator n=1 Tax=Nocardia panacis TaxID=2340916 RepID=A0A3A4K9W3_9NOCA|nr:AraC family transcriptional regulator [Nocardia panacis]RJO69252.1 AraC family transcriptional regulator [Nocardia panacis]
MPPRASADLRATKAILYPHEQARFRTLRRLEPGPVTGHFVEWYWAVDWDLRGRPPYYAQVLPYPSVILAFERTAAATGGFVYGVCTTKSVRELSGVGETFAVLFRAGGFGAFTGREVGALRDAVLPLTEVLPEADGLTEAVLAAGTDVARRALLEDFLSRRRSTPDANYLLVLRVVAAMAADPELTRVDQVTERFDIPVRTLQRLFRRYIGAGPKWVLRRYRLQDGADLIDRGRVADLATLAADLGYFDQAHFSREFGAEIGITPAEYAKHARRGPKVPW